MQAMGGKGPTFTPAGLTRSAARPAISAAETCFLRAIETSQQQDARAWELRAIMSLHRLRIRQGKSRESLSLLKETFDWFTEGFETADLREARALLAESSTTSF